MIFVPFCTDRVKGVHNNLHARVVLPSPSPANAWGYGSAASLFLKGYDIRHLDTEISSPSNTHLLCNINTVTGLSLPCPFSCAMYENSDSPVTCSDSSCLPLKEKQRIDWGSTHMEYHVLYSCCTKFSKLCLSVRLWWNRKWVKTSLWF